MFYIDMSEIQAEPEFEQEEQQPVAEVVKRGRGRLRKGCEVRKVPDEEKQTQINKSEDPSYFRDYYHKKVRPLKLVQKQIKEEFKKKEIEKTKEITRELLNMSADDVVSQIRSSKEPPKIAFSNEKLCEIMNAICKKLDIEI